MDPKRPFGSRRPEPVERRRAKRDQLGISVSMLSTTQSRVVFMIDASQTGARISGLNLPNSGKDVLVKIGGVELFGTIVRSGDGEAAIAFDRPIGARELEQLREILDEQTREATLFAG